MHRSPLLKSVPMMGSQTVAFMENGKKFSAEEVGRILTDYITQGQVLVLVMGLLGEGDGRKMDRSTSRNWSSQSSI